MKPRNFNPVSLPAAACLGRLIITDATLQKSARIGALARKCLRACVCNILQNQVTVSQSWRDSGLLTETLASAVGPRVADIIG